MSHNLDTFLLNLVPYPIEPKDLAHYFADFLALRQQFVAEKVLLEELVFPVHVRTVEQSVPVDDLLPETLTDVPGEVIGLAGDVVLVGRDVLTGTVVLV